MSKPHEEWFARAEDDYKFAKVGLREKFYSQVCFLSQQVIEKILKGCLVSQNKMYPKTHKLVDLFRLCNLKWLKPFENKLKLIDEFYIPTRYPDGIPGGLPNRLVNESDAKEALSVADEILQLAFEKVK
jgi:HEPN domain-containing protein